MMAGLVERKHACFTTADARRDEAVGRNIFEQSEDERSRDYQLGMMASTIKAHMRRDGYAAMTEQYDLLVCYVEKLINEAKWFHYQAYVAVGNQFHVSHARHREQHDGLDLIATILLDVQDMVSAEVNRYQDAGHS